MLLGHLDDAATVGLEHFPGEGMVPETTFWRGLAFPAAVVPASEKGRAFVMRGHTGPIVMLNLLRFRAQADCAADPQLAPSHPISGAEPYRRYIEHTLPHLQASGGELVFYGSGGPFLIGPEHERWDSAMLVRQKSVADFTAFNSNHAYLAGLGRRTAAVEDSRLLPLVEDAGP